MTVDCVRSLRICQQKSQCYQGRSRPRLLPVAWSSWVWSLFSLCLLLPLDGMESVKHVLYSYTGQYIMVLWALHIYSKYCSLFERPFVCVSRCKKKCWKSRYTNLVSWNTQQQSARQHCTPRLLSNNWNAKPLDSAEVGYQFNSWLSSNWVTQYYVTRWSIDEITVGSIAIVSYSFASRIICLCERGVQKSSLSAINKQLHAIEILRTVELLNIHLSD